MAVNDVNAKAADSAAREHFMMLLPGRGRLAGAAWAQAYHAGGGEPSRRIATIRKNFRKIGAARAEYYGFSSTSVSGRSLPAAVSVCHLPSGVSYSIASVRPGTRCSAAARLAAASAAAWVGKGSENTPSTV